MAKTNGKANGARKAHADQPLPGMEEVRVLSIQRKLGAIAELRAQLNELRQTEAGLLQTTLNLMRKHELMSCRARGVEVFRVPGEEKLRVRTTKESATAETEDGEQIEDGDDAADESLANA